MKRAELRERQRPLKERYRLDPEAAWITLTATGALGEGVSCSVRTGRAIAEAGLEIPVSAGTVTAEGDLDFRGTLAIDREAPVGFAAIRLRFELESDADDAQLDTLLRLTERYCVVLQTITATPEVSISRTVARHG